MRHKKRRRRSKLKLRPYGVITVQTGESEEAPVNKAQPLRQPVNRVSRNLKRQKKPNILFSLLKGLAIVGLLVVAFSWTTIEPFHAKTSGNAESPDSMKPVTSSATNAKVDATSVDAISQSEPENTQVTPDKDDNSAPIPTATTDNAVAKTTNEKEKTTDIQNNSAAVTATTETDAGNTEPKETELPETIPLVADTQNTASLTSPHTSPPATENQPDTTEFLAPESTPDNSNIAFIIAYKASIFSSLSANATETPIAHNTAVAVLERSGDWVKIEVSSDRVTGNGTIGYIHITHLSIR